MDYTIVLSQLSTLMTREPDNVLAHLTSRWITSEAAQGRGNEAAQDPLIAGIIDRARLATDCGWTPTEHIISSSKAFLRAHINSRTITDLEIYCDGSCINNGKPDARAGYGVYVVKDGVAIHSHSSRVPFNDPQTNQRAELLAIQYSLNYVGESGLSAIIYTDSKYAIDCLTTWAPAWECAGWKKSDKKPILHLDVIQPTIELFRMIGDRVQMKHIVGHIGHKGNEEADRLAKIGAQCD